MNALKDKANIFKIHIPVLHVLLSFLYEKLTWQDLGLYDPYIKTIELLGVTYEEERIVLMVFTKLFGILLIFLFWRLIDCIMSTKDKKTGALLLIGAAFCLIEYPLCYTINEASPVLYYMSAGYHPDYYHGFFFQVWYGACLTVFRHAVMIPLMQTVIFLLILRFLSVQIDKAGHHKLSLFVYAILLLPESVNLMISPDPASLTALFLTVLSLLVLHFGKRLLIPVGKRTIAKNLVIFASITVILYIPQAVGEYTYLGHETYLEKNWNTISAILSDKNANVTYAGADADLLAINDVVPVEDLVSYEGTDAFYNRNYAEYEKVHQSLLPYEDQVTLIHAVKRL
ncbi:MAG: hypothetical protein K6G07_02155, partial [Lachnospiraceae bacterium]|nr:hypothetical protein [Lachnospiraceae bacterium]